MGAPIKSEHQSFLCLKSPICHLLKRIQKLLSCLHTKHMKHRVPYQLFSSPSKFSFFTYCLPLAFRSNQQQPLWLRENYGDGNKHHLLQFLIYNVSLEHILTVMIGVWAGWLMWDHTGPRSVDLTGNRLESVGIAWFITLCGLKGDRWKYLLPTPLAESSGHYVPKSTLMHFCPSQVEGMRTCVKAGMFKGTVLAMHRTSWNANFQTVQN